MGLLQTLCLVKMDTVDGKKPVSAAAEKKQPARGGAAADVGGGYSPYHSGAAAANDCRSPEPPEGNDHRPDTEMKGELQETARQLLYAFTVKFLNTRQCRF